MTIAAGNSGPSQRTVNDPAIAFNDLSVGAFSGGGTSDPSDDTVFGWSSRGPTVGGRKKPDLVAVGDGGLAYSYYETTGKLWKYDTGTSYAAPQVGGGALLLAGAGIRDPKVVKAILINSARPGRATPSAPMGTQAGWLPDWGWGELNLDAAYRERLNFARGDIAGDTARFFRANVQSPGDRATLVWHRRVADCQPLRQGCYYDTNSGFRVYTLSNLDLTEYDATTGAERGTSASTVDNVEQVRSAAPGTVVYKVAAGQVDGPLGEPFAIAATREVTPLATPRPTTSLTLDATNAKRAGDPVRVDATVANPSPDLTAENAQVTLTLPAGVELVTGQQTQPLGTLQKQGSAGDRATASWTVRGTTDGLKQLIASASATRYGSTFRSSATSSFSVDARPPAVTVSAAAPASPHTIDFAWGGSDDSGVTRFDIESNVNGGPFSPWLTATTATSGQLAVTTGNRYRVRVRATDTLGNTSPFVLSDEVPVAGTGDQSSAPPPNPADNHPPASRAQSPQLRIAAVRMKGRRLIVRGSVATGASGKIAGVWIGRVQGSRRSARSNTYAHLRGFRLAFDLPRRARRGRLTVTYVGNRHFATQVLHATVRSRAYAGS
jgi:hypothetical protein